MTTSKVDLVINHLTEKQYTDALENGQINDNEIYVTSDDSTVMTSTGDTLPIGFVGYFAADKPATNWLRCDGREVSRTNYAELFNVIGTTYGTGDGSTTFNLPDLRERVVVGQAGDGEFSLGNTGGSKTHKLTIDEMPSHSHTYTYQGHEARIPGWVYSSGGDRFSLSDVGYVIDTPGLAGGSQPHNNMPPYIVLYPIIKAKQSAGFIGEITSSIHDTNGFAVPVASVVKEYVDETAQETKQYVDKLQTYSKSEQIIGTWYDNKPIYRKVYEFNPINLPTHEWVNIVNVSDLNIKRLVNARLLGNQSTSGHLYGGAFQVGSEYLQAYCPYSYGQFVLVIIEYTKTTDEVVE